MPHTTLLFATSKFLFEKNNAFQYNEGTSKKMLHTLLKLLFEKANVLRYIEVTFHSNLAYLCVYLYLLFHDFVYREMFSA
jgi:hypothetical protein